MRLFVIGNGFDLLHSCNYKMKRFVSAAILKSGKKADVLITVKESIANGHRIYSIELDEINKASEKFRA